MQLMRRCSAEILTEERQNGRKFRMTTQGTQRRSSSRCCSQVRVLVVVVSGVCRSWMDGQQFSKFVAPWRCLMGGSGRKDRRNDVLFALLPS